MFLVRGEEMASLDKLTINSLGIPGMVLMENAGVKVVDTVKQILGNLSGKKITIIAGKGNNGGDGFVIARHLLNQGCEVQVMLIADPNELRGDAKSNYEILSKLKCRVYSVVNVNSLNLIKVAVAYADIIIDAVYGTGFKGKVDEHMAKIFQLVNESGKKVFAVDIASGVEASTGNVHGKAIRANMTISFALPKIGHIVSPGSEYCGKLKIVDIGIPQKLVMEQGFDTFLITEAMVRNLLPKRAAESHKGNYGRALIIAGSVGMTGAAVLTATGALKIGAGLITVGTPNSVNAILEVKLTEVMTRPLPDSGGSLAKTALNDIRELVQGATVMAIGPGLGSSEETCELVRAVVTASSVPLVIDADGLNAFVGHTYILKEISVPIILTPHPGELARLMGISIDELQANRLAYAREFARDYKVTIILKGNKSIIATPDNSAYINMTGNPGMATGGSGDVLTGMVAGLVSQGLDVKDAGVAATYLHGKVGDVQSKDKGFMGLTPTDLLAKLPELLKEIGNY